MLISPVQESQVWITVFWLGKATSYDAVHIRIVTSLVNKALSQSGKTKGKVVPVFAAKVHEGVKV